MAYRIVTAQCTACGACEFECPNAAIGMQGESYVIDAGLCTECAGQFDNPQCAEICPVPGTCVPG
ncbi:4Fe-4S binding protein [Rhodovulum strictum]|uniref:Ferredoxin n=1 Tax=Rhodovulum strictum TaxID=58314 RepID=A0A844BPQ6_9RHOB|nr:4Fe-4S binding protein [Rhodovulum strictum]MRH22923.1 ferredoxin [Rhodovulum strictum]